MIQYSQGTKMVEKRFRELLDTIWDRKVLVLISGQHEDHIFLSFLTKSITSPNTSKEIILKCLLVLRCTCTFSDTCISLILVWKTSVKIFVPKIMQNVPCVIPGSADKSLARQRRKQATATKLKIYSTYALRSSIPFLAHCSNVCKPLKKNSEGCPSNQVSAAAMTSASDEKWRHFNCLFSPRNRW